MNRCSFKNKQLRLRMRMYFFINVQAIAENKVVRGAHIPTEMSHKHV
jgi:hypothetical protein